MLLTILPASFCYAQQEKTTQPLNQISTFPVSPANTPKEKETKQRPWKELQYKNSLSLDISPAIGFIAGKLPGESESPESIGATYRHFWKNKHVLRISYRSTFQRINYNDAYGPDAMGYTYIYPDSIKLFTQQVYISLEERWHTIKAGYEYWAGRRRVKGIFGIDLTNGYYISNSVLNRTQFETETYKLGFDTFNVTGFLDIDYSTEQIFSPDIYTARSYIIGFTPMIGMNIHASKRISFTMHLYYDFYWNIARKETGYPIIGISNFIYPGIKGISDPFFGDISLTYHFGKGKSPKKAE